MNMKERGEYLLPVRDSQTRKYQLSRMIIHAIKLCDVAVMYLYMFRQVVWHVF